MMEKIKIVVTGPCGKMEQSVLNLIREVDSFELVGVIDSSLVIWKLKYLWMLTNVLKSSTRCTRGFYKYKCKF